MSKEILWSKPAEEDLGELLEYLSTNWNNSIVKQFIKVLDLNLARIINNPYISPYIHEEMLIRKCVLTKQNTLYYKIQEKSILILRIYDTRQDPNNLQFL